LALRALRRSDWNQGELKKIAIGVARGTATARAAGDYQSGDLTARQITAARTLAAVRSAAVPSDDMVPAYAVARAIEN